MDLAEGRRHTSGKNALPASGTTTHDWLVGEGGVAELIRAKDWSRTSLGPRESWPENLRTTVSIVLASSFPICVIWGEGAVQIWNDAYAVICGEKHPGEFGSDYRVCWESAWPSIGGAFEVARAGQTAYLTDQPMFLDRLGYLEETWFTFSLSPIFGERGEVAGLFHPVTETTAHNLAQRRTRTLRELAERMSTARTTTDALAQAREVLARSTHDLPLAALYTQTAEATPQLQFVTGVEEQFSSALGALSQGASSPVALAAASGQRTEIADVRSRWGEVLAGPWSDPLDRLLLIPLLAPGIGELRCVLALGLSGRLPHDELYAGHIDLVAQVLSSGLSSAVSYERERERAEQLAELDRAKTTFFSNVSHEFRTPLTLMLGPLEEELSSEEFARSGHSRERLEAMQRNCLRLLRMVNSLLDFSRIQSGRAQASFEPTDLPAYTADLASLFRAAVEQAGMALVVDCPPLERPVWVDRAMWEKIVTNLLSNAFKHTFEGEIRIALSSGADGGAVLTVTDTGVGIPNDELPLLFERFHRVKNARSRTSEGTGIGLALVRELVQLHGGEVQVSSTPGGGTTFTVAIPGGFAHLPAEHRSDASGYASASDLAHAQAREALSWLAGETSGADVAELPQPASEEERLGAVMVVDDNEDMRRHLARLLRPLFAVSVYPDGQAALDAALVQRPDVVLTDVMMPRRDGFGLLAALRADPRTSTVPVIMLSARAGEESSAEGRAAGADDYLVKPFSAKQLLARVSGTLALSRLRFQTEQRLEQAGRAEQQRAERATAQLAAIVESSDDSIIGMTLDGQITSWNRGAERIYGYSAAEALGSHISILLPAEREGEQLGPLARVGAGERVAHRESTRRRKDGQSVDVSVTLSPILDQGGQVIGASSVARDITERKRAERELERLAQATHHGSEAIVSFDLDMRVRHWNAGAQRLSGFRSEQVIGLSIDELNALTGEPEESRIAARETLRRALRGERVNSVEAQRRRRDGTVYDVLCTFSAWRVDGRIVGASNTAVDITERKRAERELERLAQAAEYGADAIVSFDRDMRVRHWNAGAERVSGVRAEEVIGLSIDELNALTSEPPQTGIRGREAIASILRGESGYQVEAQRRRRDGTVFDVLSTFVPWRVDGRLVGATNTTVDITERKRAERVREQALAELQQAQRVANLGSWTWDPATNQTRWSAQMYEIFAREQTHGPLTGKALLNHVHSEDRDHVAAVYAQALDGAPSLELDCRIVVGGTERPLYMLAHADPARPGAYTGTVQDVTKMRAAERALRAAEERFRHAFEDAPIGIALLTLDGRLEQVNAALATLYGSTRLELEGTPLSGLLHPADIELAAEHLRALASGADERAAVELRIMSAVGSPVDVIMHASALRYGNAGPTRLLCQVQDITERKRFESELQYMADHDPRTGLLNRRKFEAELHRHVTHVKRYGPAGALLVLDLDHFKIVNDTLGHNAGDELIISIASVLRQRLRESDVLARLGGDEFAVLLPEADQAEAAQVASTLLNAVRTNTALLGGERKKVTTSIGVAMFDASSEELSSETALIEADLAMYDAKEAGRDGYTFYATSEHPASRTKARLTWVARIEQALENDRFVLVAQPILDLHAGKVSQHELLIRMLDEHDDMVPPAAFLYIAERFGLIAKLDEWVVTHAIELIEQHPELHLEVNISGRSLGNQTLLHAVDQHLRTSQIDPTHLILEVTETAAVANITHAQAFARHLRDLGCRFALDDFGAGFGSFYYLKHLPFDYVKIDGEFIRHATTGRIDQLVVQAVVHIAQGLGKQTIAEFVTNEKTKQMVARLGVDYVQGYHIGKPVPFPELLNTRAARPAPQ